MEPRQHEQRVLSGLLPSVSLTTAEQEAIAMWTSDPPRFPELTDEELADLIQSARVRKGQLLYSQAYGRRAKGVREFPAFDAKSFRDLVFKRGSAYAIDEEWDKPFAIDADNEAVIKILALYFTKDERFKSVKPGYSFRKGIYLAGDRGVGKTKLARLCDRNPFCCYTIHPCGEIAGEYEDKKEGGQSIIDYYSGNSAPSETDQAFGQQIIGRLFDDLGHEETARHFGKDKNVMASIIENRYRVGAYQLTHFTSNHTIDQLSDIYGPRVSDRLLEMCNVIEFPATAKSRRG